MHQIADAWRAPFPFTINALRCKCRTPSQHKRPGRCATLSSLIYASARKINWAVSRKLRATASPFSVHFQCTALQVSHTHSTQAARQMCHTTLAHPELKVTVRNFPNAMPFALCPLPFLQIISYRYIIRILRFIIRSNCF